MRWELLLAILVLAAGSVMAQQHDDGGKSDEVDIESGVGNQTNGDNVGTETDYTAENTHGIIARVVEKYSNTNTSDQEIQESLEQRLRERLQLKEEIEYAEQKNGQKIRERIREELQNAREDSEEFKQNYLRAREKYSEAKEKGRSEQAHFQAQELTRGGINYMNTWLNRTELRVLNSHMDNETKLSILQKIDQYRDSIEQKKEMINGTANVTEMRVLAHELNDQWKEIRLFIKATGYQIAAEKVENVVQRSENVWMSLENKRNTAKNESKFDQLLNYYGENMEASEEELDQASGILLNATTNQELVEGHRLLNKATNHLHQAFKNIRLIHNELRS